MKILTSYLSTLPTSEQAEFAARCGTTVGYLRKASSIGQKLGDVLCLRIAAESRGAIRPEDLRDDVDWDYLRAALFNSSQAPESAAFSATETVAEQGA